MSVLKDGKIESFFWMRFVSVHQGKSEAKANEQLFVGLVTPEYG